MKCKKNTRIKTMILAVVLLISVLTTPQTPLTVATVTDTVLTLKSVEEYAEKQIDNIAESADINKWKGCSISKETALFDTDSKINAYYLELEKNGKGCGYVIVSAEDSGHILEYSYNGGDSFLTEAKETVSEEYDINIREQKIYYLGGMSYAIGGTDQDGMKRYIDVSTGEANEISKSTM